MRPDGFVLEPTGREGQHSAELFGLPLEALADLVHLELGIVQRAVENLVQVQSINRQRRISEGAQSLYRLEAGANPKGALCMPLKVIHSLGTRSVLPSNTLFLTLVVCCEWYPFDLDLTRLSYDHR